MEGIEGSRFWMVNHLILETFREGQVCATEQSGFTVFITKSRDNPVEFHKEPNSFMVIFHYQLFQFGFRIAKGVIGVLGSEVPEDETLTHVTM